MLQTADALAHAHKMGVLQRDIKPSNIMIKQVLGREPVAKILDFELAKFTEPDAARHRRLTRTSQMSALYQPGTDKRPTSEATSTHSAACY